MEEGLGAGQVPADELIEAALEACRAGDLLTGADCMRRAALGAPLEARLWHWLGDLYDRQGQPGRALAAYEQSLAVDPGVARIGQRAEALRAVVMQEPGHRAAYQEEKRGYPPPPAAPQPAPPDPFMPSWLRPGVPSAAPWPTNPDPSAVPWPESPSWDLPAVPGIDIGALVRQAVEAKRAGRYAEAADSFLRALQEVPRQADYWDHLAECHLLAGQYGSALAALEQLSTVNPAYPQLEKRLEAVGARVRSDYRFQTDYETHKVRYGALGRGDRGQPSSLGAALAARQQAGRKRGKAAGTEKGAIDRNETLGSA